MKSEENQNIKHVWLKRHFSIQSKVFIFRYLLVRKHLSKRGQNVRVILGTVCLLKWISPYSTTAEKSSWEAGYGEIHFSTQTVPRITRIFWPLLLKFLRTNKYLNMNNFQCTQRWHLSQACFIFWFSSVFNYQEKKYLHHLENTKEIWISYNIFLFSFIFSCL